MAEQYGFTYIFKASFDKANRTAASSFRGTGLENGLEILKAVKDKLESSYSLPSITALTVILVIFSSFNEPLYKCKSNISSSDFKGILIEESSSFKCFILKKHF